MIRISWWPDRVSSTMAFRLPGRNANSVQLLMYAGESTLMTPSRSRKTVLSRAIRYAFLTPAERLQRRRGQLWVEENRLVANHSLLTTSQQFKPPHQKVPVPSRRSTAMPKTDDTTRTIRRLQNRGSPSLFSVEIINLLICGTSCQSMVYPPYENL